MYEPVVYVVQDQRLRNEAGQLIRKFDLSPAMEFGKLDFLLGPDAVPWDPEPIIATMHAKLSNFCDEDFLLLLGNPCLIGWAVAIAGDYNDGRVSLLQWTRFQRRYNVIRAKMFEDADDQKD